MGVRLGNVSDLARLVRGLLDSNYDRAITPVLRAIAASKDAGLMAERNDQLEAEAERLAEAGETWKIDNPVLSAWLADFEASLVRDRERVAAIAGRMQALGVDAAQRLTPEITFAGLPVEARMLWNAPDPRAVGRAIDYANKPAWDEQLKKMGVRTVESVRNAAIRGIVRGTAPTAVANEIIKAGASLSVHQARTLTRTLMLSSYRQAAALNQEENRSILVGQVRIAVLDGRTCMACVAQHGQRLAIGEVIKDHHNGRCTAVSLVKGYPRQIGSGADWFGGLDENQQRQMMGAKAFEDWKAGKFDLQDMVTTYDDDVFGQMTRQASLAEIYKNIS